MQRIRNEQQWKMPFKHYESAQEFLQAPRLSGGHSITIEDDVLDVLVEDRGSSTTLIVFSGALSLHAKTTPAFSGLKLAADTQVNLISVADPSMSMGEITVAWYLGNYKTGPLRSVLSQLLHHILKSLGSSRTILFGGSGGGYAAAHHAQDFPDSIAFIFNPRLNLKRGAERALRIYLKNCHKVQLRGAITPPIRDILTKFGPLQLDDRRPNNLNHDLLIYQNLLDPEFLEYQLLPYLQSAGADPRLHLQLSLDDLGHTPIPGDIVRKIVTNLANVGDTQEAIAQAGFQPPSEAYFSAIKMYPILARRLQSDSEYDWLRNELSEQSKELRSIRQHVRTAETKLIRFRKRAETAESKNLQLQTENLELHNQRSDWRAAQKRLIRFRKQAEAAEEQNQRLQANERRLNNEIAELRNLVQALTAEKTFLERFLSLRAVRIAGKVFPLGVRRNLRKCLTLQKGKK